MASNHVIKGRTKSNGWKLLSDGVTNNFLGIKEKPQGNELNEKVLIKKQRLDDQSFVSPEPTTVPGKYNKCSRNNYWANLLV